MAVIRQVYGIGKSKVIASPGGDAPEKTFLLPLTMQGGFSVIWSDESFIQRLIGLDIETREITERQVVIDGFGNFTLDWSGLPMPYSFVQQAVDMWNIRGTYTFRLYPKYEQYIGLPNLFFNVNLIGQEGLNFNTSDNVYSSGTFGIKLYFRTTTNQKITIGQAEGTGGTITSAVEIVT